MKTLLILRHAKSSWDEPGLDDCERPLNKRGEKDAPRVGQLLKAKNLVPDLIITSSAKRARQTSELVSKHCRCPGKIEKLKTLYADGPAAYVKALSSIKGDPVRVLIVGHNPDIETLLEDLTGRTERLPTAALALVELPIQRWTDFSPATKGRLLDIWRPKEL